MHWLLVLVVAAGLAHADDRADVRNAVKPKRMAIAACYEREGTFEPRVVVDFVVRRDGTVSVTRTTGPGSTTLHRCIATQFAVLKLPRRNDVLKVSYPVRFDVAR